MLSGLIIEQNSQLNIEKWITIAGLLNHEKWTELLKLQPLKNSLNLKKIPITSDVKHERQEKTPQCNGKQQTRGA